MNITLELPKRSKIVVFGNDSYELLDLFNKHSVAYTIYNESSGNINVNPIFILKYIINIILKSRSTKIKQLLYNAYHLTNLEYINPKYTRGNTVPPPVDIKYAMPTDDEFRKKKALSFNKCIDMFCKWLDFL